MASRALAAVLPCLDAMDPERPAAALVSDVLEEIFLRVASPADLARASAACVSFRGLIRSPTFLRRYRSLHPPRLLGFVNREGFNPVEATHPAAADGVVARTVDLSYSFLPHGPQGWCAHDARDGRVLAACKFQSLHDYYRRRRRENMEIAVCDPVFQRYLLLPPITDDLLASVGLHNKDMVNSWTSFIPCGGTGTGTGTEETSSSSFGVICWMYSRTRLGVFIFSSTSSAHWTAVKSVSWADLGVPEDEEADIGLNAQGQCVHMAASTGNYTPETSCSSLTWTLWSTFSMYDLPRNFHNNRSIVVVEAAEGKVAMFSANNGEGSVEYYTFTQNGADDADKSYKWHLKSTITIPMPVHGRRRRRFSISGQAQEGYVFLNGIVQEHRVKHI